MHQWANQIIEQALYAGVRYADIRIVDRSSEILQLWDGEIEELQQNRSVGYGIRVLVDNAWGFACSSDFSAGEKIVSQAINIARASFLPDSNPIPLLPIKSVCDKWETKFQIDPRKVSINERIDLLQAADAEMAKINNITQRKASMGFYFTDQLFVSSEGSVIEQTRTECGAGLVAFAADHNEAQHRSFPSSFQGNYAGAGYEHILQLGLIEGGRICANEAAALLKAKDCPEKTTTVILDTSLLALQIHESIGHALEADRVLGTEASYAGTSFATPDKLGSFAYGSPAVTITADSTIPGGLMTFGYDDEGSPAKRTTLIDKGILNHYQTSRETASILSLPLTGNMVADGWQRTPLIRMTSVNLEPGDSSLEELISSTDDGILMKTTKTYSIDDKRLNFQFGPEIAWEINNGKLGAMLKNVRYGSTTPDFWNACDGVAGKEDWKLWGIPVCGKGEPSQVTHVSHGSSPARFRNIQVGGTA